MIRSTVRERDVLTLTFAGAKYEKLQWIYVWKSYGVSRLLG